MDDEILKRGFKLVEYIYDNPNELNLSRIKEVGNGLGPKHWSGKQWLVNCLSDYIGMEDIHVAAGWLGLTSYLLRKEFPDNTIVNSDIDPGCKIMGEYLFNEYNINFETRDTTLNVPDCKVYINTSIEHIEQKYVEHIYRSLNKGTIVAVQSNNYYSVDDHVNCVDSLEEFVIKTPLSNINYSGTMSFENHDRYMVIGVI